MSRHQPPSNEAALATGFAVLRARLGGEFQALPADPPILGRLGDAFGLSRFERAVLLLLAGVELDGPLAEAAQSRPDAARFGAPSFAMALATLPEAHWSALSPGAPLRHWRLVEVDDQVLLAQARLRIDERILHHLVGVDHPDPRLAGLVRPLIADIPAVPSQAAIAAELIAALAAARDVQPVVLLSGTDPDAMADIARALAEAEGRCGLDIVADLVPAAPAEAAILAILIAREAMLCHGLPVLRATDRLQGPALRLADALPAPLIVIAPEPAMLVRPTLSRRVDRPAANERLQLWRQSLPGLDAEAAIRIAVSYRLSGRAIRTEARIAPDADPVRLEAAARVQGNARLDALATRIACHATLDALILPATERRTVAAIITQMRLRPELELKWKSAQPLGIAALFTGESGTGKSMAAEVIAGELGLDLYRIDLAQTVSKYIGETEKNLRTLFDAAEESGAVLLFDEADALFGKRSEVRDAHDRYANIEVGYLLQRLERYAGLAILTSNLRHALDPAFQRRLRFIIAFPFPNAAARADIWRTAFPQSMGVDGLDFARLGQLAVAGGAIRVIALNAAYAAEAEAAPLAMRHVLDAARTDAAKRERPLSDAETRGWE